MQFSSFATGSWSRVVRRAVGEANTWGNRSRALPCSEADSGFGDDTPGSASYAQSSTDDEITIPYTRCFLKGGQRTALTHHDIYDDPIAQEFLLNGLNNPGPSKPGPRRPPSAMR